MRKRASMQRQRSVDDPAGPKKDSCQGVSSSPSQAATALRTTRRVRSRSAGHVRLATSRRSAPISRWMPPLMTTTAIRRRSAARRKST
jgi:hypothetical protein